MRFSERVGSHAGVLSEIVVVAHEYAQTQRQPVLRLVLVVNFDAVLGRRGGCVQSSSVFRPVVDSLRERRDDALEDRLAATPLSDATVRQVDLRCN